MSRPLKVYIAAVITAGALSLTAAALWSDQPSQFAKVGHWMFFLLLGCLLELMVVPMAHGGFVSAGFAAFFAYLVLAGPVAAISIAALGTLLSDWIGQRRPPLFKTVFNIAHVALALLAAGQVFLWMGGTLGRIIIARDLGPMLGAASVLFLIEVTAVNVAVALERKSSFLTVWLGNAKLVAPLDAGLAGMGALLAGLYSWREELFPGAYGPVFTAVVVLVPSALLYYASKLYAEMRQVYERTLSTLASVVETKDPGVQGHCARVAELAVALGQAMHLSQEELEALHYAGYLHDIGKVALPGMLLRKHPLNPEELAQIRQHPLLGKQILLPVEFLKLVSELVECHHEHFDGSGLLGRAGGEIPLGSRILYAVEKYDGLVQGRFSRFPVTPARALEQMREQAGTRFDPLVLDTLAEVLSHREFLASAPQREAAHAI